jgi:hypothetical protein
MGMNMLLTFRYGLLREFSNQPQNHMELGFYIKISFSALKIAANISGKRKRKLN